MAESLKNVAASDFDADALRKSIARINKEKEKAAEFVSAAGAATKNAIDEMNLDKAALTFVARLARKEADQQQATIAAAVTYAHAMGMFDQLSLFSEAARAMEAALAAANGGDLPIGSNVTKLAGSPVN